MRIVFMFYMNAAVLYCCWDGFNVCNRNALLLNWHSKYVMFSSCMSWMRSTNIFQSIYIAFPVLTIEFVLFDTRLHYDYLDLFLGGNHVMIEWEDMLDGYGINIPRIFIFQWTAIMRSIEVCYSSIRNTMEKGKRFSKWNCFRQRLHQFSLLSDCTLYVII